METGKVIPGAEIADQRQWYVMRDLKRCNAKLPAYKLLGDMKIEIFTPMVWKLVVRQGKRIPQRVPFMQDLLFVHERRRILDPIVERIGTLQYRFLRDGHRSPMTVDDTDMNRFMQAVASSENPCYYTPREITPDMVGRSVRIIGGPFNGLEGRLQKMQDARTRRLFVELPNLLIVSVEVQAEFIELLKK